LTLQRQTGWGQTALFAGETPAGPRRDRVFDGAHWGPATTSLALAAAQARAVALGGRSALLWAEDGTGVTVAATGAGFLVTADVCVPWAATCGSLLNRHG
jgi:hypothetical protein